MSAELMTQFHSLDLEGTGKQFISGTYELKLFWTTEVINPVRKHGGIKNQILIV